MRNTIYVICLMMFAVSAQAQVYSIWSADAELPTADQTWSLRNLPTGSIILSASGSGFHFNVPAYNSSGDLIGASGGGSTSPAGSDTQFQRNNFGVFGAVTGATSSGSTAYLTSPVFYGIPIQMGDSASGIYGELRNIGAGYARYYFNRNGIYVGSIGSDSTGVFGLGLGAGTSNNIMSFDSSGNITTNGSITTPTNNSNNWDIGYSERHQWDGGSTNLNASTGRASLGLGSASLRNAEDTLTNGSNLPDGAAITTYIAGLGYVTTSDDTVSGSELDGLFLNGILIKTGTNTFSQITDNSTDWNRAVNDLYSSTGWIKNASLATGLDATKIGTGLVSNTIFNYIQDVTQNIQYQINHLPVGGGTGTPAGSSGQLQYNNSGSFGGMAYTINDGGYLKATSPEIVTGIRDSNGNNIITLPPTSSAVNYLNINNNITGYPVKINSEGSDTNVGLDINGKGSGNLRLQYGTGGNVGIGTTGNLEKFAVQSSNDREIARFIGSGTPGTYIRLTENGIASWYLGMDDGSSTFNIRYNTLTTSPDISINNSGQIALGAGTAPGSYGLRVNGTSYFADNITTGLNLIIAGRVGIGESPSPTLGTPTFQSKGYGSDTKILFSNNSADDYVELGYRTEPYLTFDDSDTLHIGTKTDASYALNTTTDVIALNTSGVGIGQTPSTTSKLAVTGKAYTSAGIYIGAENTTNLIDDSSNGIGTTTLYIGNQSITTAITAGHSYAAGEDILTASANIGTSNIKGMAVVLGADFKIHAATQANDPSCIGIYWGIPTTMDAKGRSVLINATSKLITAGRIELGQGVWVPVNTAEGVAYRDIVEDTTEVIGYELADDPISASTPVYATKVVGHKPYVKSGYRWDKKNKVMYHAQINDVTKTIISDRLINRFTGLPAKPKDYAYKIAVLGDSYEDHDTYPMTGAWVSVDNGTINVGDLLSSSSHNNGGWLAKQLDANGNYDPVVRPWTVGKAMEPIENNTKKAYIYLIN